MPKHLVCLFVLAAIASGCGGGSNGSSTPASSPDPSPLKVLTTTEYLPTLGYPTDMALMENGDIVVSVSSQPGMSTTNPITNPVAGLQIFKYGNGSYSNPCTSASGVLDPVNSNVHNVFGIKSLPGVPHAIAAAIDNLGVQFSTILNLNTCNQSVVTQVAQRTSYLKPETGAPVYPGTFDVVFSKDGSHAFVANEYGATDADLSLVGTVGILKVARHPGTGSFAGTAPISGGFAHIFIPNATTLPSITISHDGKRLYVMSEVADSRPNPDLSFNPNADPTESANPILTGHRCMQSSSIRQWNGLLTVVDVEKAIQGLGQQAITRVIAAGCSPVRAVESTDGKTLWVTARGDNRVLAYDVAKLTSDKPNESLLGYADTGGAAPVGMALFYNNQLLAITNSNRFNLGDATSNDANVSILDVRNPAKASVVLTLPAHYHNSFPRNIRVGADDTTLYVSNFLRGELQVVKTKIE